MIGKRERKLRMPEPEAGKDVLVLANPALAQPGNQPPGAVSLAALSATAPTAEDSANIIAAKLADAAAPAMSGLLAPIRKLVAEAASLTELRAGLMALYGELPSDELAVVMSQAFELAALAGRSDAGSARGD